MLLTLYYTNPGDEDDENDEDDEKDDDDFENKDDYEKDYENDDDDDKDENRVSNYKHLFREGVHSKLVACDAKLKVERERG